MIHIIGLNLLLKEKQMIKFNNMSLNNIKSKIYNILFALLLLFACPIPSSEASDYLNQMSLSSIVMFALDNNPDIKMAKEKVVQSSYMVDDAKAAYYPQVKLNAAWGRQYNSPAGGVAAGKSQTNNSGEAMLVVKQLLFDGFSTTQEIKAQKALSHSSKIQADIKIKKVLSECVKYYLDIFHYQRALMEVQAYYKSIENVVGVVSKLFEAGATSRASVDYTRARMAMAHSELTEARSSLNDAMSNLEYLTGNLPDFTAVAPDMLDPENINLGFYVKYARENNVNMILNESNKRSVDHKINSEKGKLYPKLSFQLEVEEKENDGGKTGRTSSAAALLQLNYKIFDGFSRKANIGKVRSQYKELEIKDKKIMKRLKRDIKLSYNQIISLQENIKATDLEIVSNESVKKINDVNFDLGDINIIDLIDSEEKLKNSRVRRHKLEADLYSNIYRLLIETGIIKKYYFCEACRIKDSDEKTAWK